MHKRKGLLLFLFLLGIAAPSFSQIYADEELAVPEGFYFEPKNRPIRSFLSNFNLGFQFGYAATFYSQQLNDFNILQDDALGTILYYSNAGVNDSISDGISYWYNNVKYSGPVRVDASELNFSGDSTNLRYESLAHTIPISLSIHYDYKNYKIGAGVMLEYHMPSEFVPNIYHDQLNNLQPDFKRTFLRRYYGIVGVRLFRYWEYLMGVDARIGIMRFDRNFDKSNIQHGVHVNLGFPIERQLSEYFRVFVRPSVDYKNYTLNIPESNSSVPTSMNAVMIEFGAFYRIPGLPKCFLKKCRTQVNHMHGEYQYRSKVHPFYKYQNPHHGQNYPVLIKYKGKNKKKMMPY